MLICICALLFAYLRLAQSATDLEIKCNASSRPHIFSNDSCYIVHTEVKKYYTAKVSCNDILGYSGHLIHLRSSAIQALTETLMAAVGGLTNGVWVGNEYNNGTPTTRNNSGWYYTTVTRKYEDPATYIPWNNASVLSGNVIVMKYQRNLTMSASLNTDTNAFICQYEQQYAYDITPTAVYCQSNTASTTTYYGYVDGSCFAIQYNPWIIPTAATFRKSCPNVTGMVSRVAHLSTTGKMNMVISMARATGEWYGYTAANHYFTLPVGLEQLKACSGNTCSEEGGYSWFWTTPEGYKWPANTQMTGFWFPGYPKDVSSELNYGSLCGDPGIFGIKDLVLQTTNAVICEYRAPYNFTNFENSCRLSSNPSAPGYSSCFTLVRNATTFANAQSRCTEFPNGQLARISSAQMAQFISSALWANTGLPPSQPLFTNLQQLNATSADEPDKQWYWMYPDGSKSLADATNLPWNPGQPQSTGDCASVTQNGLLNTTNCTASQWFICQYPDPSVPTNASGKHFNHYRFGRFPDNSYWLRNQLTIRFYKCIYMCNQSPSCFGVSYSKVTSDCQLLAVDPSALPYSQQLIDDSQYETVVRMP